MNQTKAQQHGMPMHHMHMAAASMHMCNMHLHMAAMAAMGVTLMVPSGLVFPPWPQLQLQPPPQRQPPKERAQARGKAKKQKTKKKKAKKVHTRSKRAAKGHAPGKPMTGQQRMEAYVTLNEWAEGNGGILPFGKLTELSIHLEIPRKTISDLWKNKECKAAIQEIEDDRKKSEHPCKDLKTFILQTDQIEKFASRLSKTANAKSNDNRPPKMDETSDANAEQTAANLDKLIGESNQKPSVDDSQPPKEGAPLAPDLPAVAQKVWDSDKADAKSLPKALMEKALNKATREFNQEPSVSNTSIATAGGAPLPAAVPVAAQKASDLEKAIREHQGQPSEDDNSPVATCAPSTTADVIAALMRRLSELEKALEKAIGLSGAAGSEKKHTVDAPSLTRPRKRRKERQDGEEVAVAKSNNSSGNNTRPPAITLMPMEEENEEDTMPIGDVHALLEGDVDIDLFDQIVAAGTAGLEEEEKDEEEESNEEKASTAMEESDEPEDTTPIGNVCNLPSSILDP